MKSRRDFLRRVGVAAAAAALLATVARPLRAAGPLRPVKMLLDWLYQGPNDGFMVARDKGYYEAAGLDVTIDSGKGSGSTAQLIANKVAQFGFADGYVVGNSVSKGMSLKMVAGVFRRNPTAVIVLVSVGLQAPKEHDATDIATPT